MIGKGKYDGGWRAYQQRLQSADRKRSALKKFPVLGLYTLCALAVLALLVRGGSWISVHLSDASYGPSRNGKTLEPVAREKPLKTEVTDLLKGLAPLGANFKDRFQCERDGRRLSVETSIDPSLQQYISQLLERSGTLKSAVVVMSPSDGRILALVSRGEGGEREPICLQADYPAASLFKVISAAAAFESANFTPDRTVYFQGRSHTLYKNQLTEKKGKYVTETSFRKAFARSINAVFGKLGIYQLGGAVMEDYSQKFLFNRQIPFDLPVGVSSLEIPDDDFGLAEIASGFNKRTQISPLHAALLAAAVANHGTVMTPWLVERVSDERGKVLFRRQPSRLASPISRKTAEELKILMHDTVVSGTCTRSFRKLRGKKIFRDVELGAKTGTINDMNDQYKIDWLIAYALPRKEEGGICIAVLGVHGEKLGVRSNELARYIINYHFSS
jgi:peptidoglycan glycosyltransferase